MANGFRTIPSAIAQQAALAQLREIQNPNLALERQIQQAVELQRIQQQSPENQLALRIQEATLQQKLREADQGKLMEVGGRLVRTNPLTGQVDVVLEATQNSNNQLVGFSGGKPILFNPRDSSISVGNVPAGIDFTGGISPKTTAPETFSTVTADQGIFRVGNRSTAGTQMTGGGENLTTPVKAVNIIRQTDASGNVFERPSTGGDWTPAMNPLTGTQLNAGVANQVISTDQGIFTAPKKTEGGAAPSSPTALTSPSGTPLTRTTGKGGATSEAGRALATETARRSVETVDELLPRVDGTTVGLAALTSGVPGSPALNFSADLDQLKSNIRIGALQEMRNASKTGGAFGNVSNQEGKVLESTLGSLDQRQGPSNMRKNLNKIKDSLNRYEEAKQKYRVSSPVATQGINPNAPSPVTPADLLKKHGF